MKVKQVPGDFVVVERATLAPRDRGRWSVYLLRKRGIGTLEALRAIRRRWKLPPRAIGFGGLKDRHAETVQWATIENGPRVNLEEPAFRLTYEGKSDVPMSRMTLVGNRFEVRLRGLAKDEAREIAARFDALARHGCLAYFDDQRFGSLRGGGGFAALHLLKGDPESALRAVIASPAREDRRAVRQRKSKIRAAWPDPASTLPDLHGTPMRAPVLYLANRPGDFLGAFGALDPEERRLLASAYASAVWNRAVATRVADALPAADRVVLSGAAGPLAHPRDPAGVAPFDGAVLPLPAEKARADDPAWQAALEAALAVDGLTLDRLTLPRRLGMDFRPTQRPVVFRPEEASAGSPAADDLNPGRASLDLAFSLGRGLYATILLKRIAAGFDVPDDFS
jgi:tRNA pseudouridine13 synthase